MNTALLPEKISMTGGDTLEVLRSSHGERLQEIFEANPDIRARVTWTAMTESVEDIQKAVELYRIQRTPRYGILSDGQLMAGLGICEAEPGVWDLSYFCDSEARGRGLVPKGVVALITAIEQGQPSVNGFRLYIADDNPSSQAVAAKLAFGRTDIVLPDEVLGCDERRYERPAYA